MASNTTETAETATKGGSTSPVNSHPNSASPPPSGPSPLLVGKSFVKQYYQTLSSSPELVGRFYKASSVLSHGLEASSPAAPVSLGPYLASPAEGTPSESTGGPPMAMKDLFSWAVPPENDPSSVVRFDFGRGAIDAQESVSGGILLVVTGHMTLPSDPSRARAFVHTFLLSDGAPTGSRKKQFYVTNDVLRFLAEDDGQLATVSRPDVVEEETQTDLNLRDVSEMEECRTELIHEKEEGKEDLIVVEQSRQEQENDDETGGNAVVNNSDSRTNADPIAIVEESASVPKSSDPTSGLSLTVEMENSASELMPKVAETEIVNEAESAQVSKNSESISVESLDQSPPQPDNGRHRQSGGTDRRSGRHRGGGRGSRGNKNGASGNNYSSSSEDVTTKSNDENADTDGSSAITSQPNPPRNHSRHHQRSSGATSTASPTPKVPGSWASLVAGGAVPSSSPSASSTNTAQHSVPSTGAQSKIIPDSVLGGAEEYKPMPELEGEDDHPSGLPPPHPVDAEADAEEKITNAANEKNRNGGAAAASGTSSGSGGATGDRRPQPPGSRTGGGRRGSHSNDREHHQHHRVPESTLFIKNVPDRTREHEIRAMFEPYVTSTGKRILQITLVANRGFCFVDFEGPDAVTAILKDKEAALAAAADPNQDEGTSTRTVVRPFIIHGRQLEVERKIIDPNKRGGGIRRDGGDGGGGRKPYRQRSASPGDGLYKGGGGRGSHHRRGSPRGGGGRDRSSGGGSGHRDRGSGAAPGGSK